jgi:hypothetical protein
MFETKLDILKTHFILIFFSEIRAFERWGLPLPENRNFNGVMWTNIV